MRSFTLKKKWAKTFLTVFFSMAILAPTMAQNKPVNGKVVDAKTKETLVGVTVKLKGTQKGTATDVNGDFNISASEGGILQISYLGFTTKEVPVVFGQSMIIELDGTKNSLNEVIVVGFGTKRKETLTGAISQVGEEVFKDRTLADPALALQGAVPGLVITKTSTRPGNEGTAIRLRGESSISAVSPLIIIDGVPTIGDYEFYALNPNDIESVTALKDASAAIYGARAQGGVILVTTKRGKGKMQVNFGSNVKINTVSNSIPWANMQQWAQLYLETSTQDRVDVNGNPVDYFPQWTKANIIRMANNEEFDYTQTNGYVSHYGDNNWQDALYGTSTSQQQNLSIRGATEKTGYLFSLGYNNDRSILKTAYDGEKKYTARFNYDYTISDKVKLQTGISYDNRYIENPKNGINAGYFDAPIFPVYNSLGQYYDEYAFRNPVASTQAGGKNKNNEGILSGNLKLTAEVLPGLKLSGSAAATNRNGWQSAYNSTYNLYSWLGDRVTSTQYKPASIEETINNTLYQNYGVFADYNKVIAKDHNFSLFIGNTAELSETKKVYAKRTDLQYSDLYTLDTANPITQTNNGTANHWGLTSYVGRFNYSYKNKYLIEALGRSDASSRFDEGFRRQNFYGVSGGWILSEENFFKKIKEINFLKIRGSYGETGGQATLGFYDYVSTIVSGNALFGSTPAFQQTGRLGSITSNLRTWERMVNKNIGVDFTLLNNKLNGTFDVFEKKNIGMLINIVYPTVLGGTAPTTNSGILRTRGWETSLNWKDKVAEVSYNIGFNLSNNKNVLVSLQGQDTWTAGVNAKRQGYALNSLFVYKTDGYFSTQAEADAYTAKYTSSVLGNLSPMVATSKLRAGDLKVVDLDGNGSLSATGDGKQGSGDVYYAGDSDPHYTFGTNLGAKWKGFDVSTFFQGVLKQNILRTGNSRGPFFRNYLNVNTYYIGQTWTPENQNAQSARLSFDANRNNWNYQSNDVNIENLQYIRLKSLVVGYSLPNSIISKLKVSRVRFYFSGTDLFTISSIKDGLDPEFGLSSDSSYPFIKTYSFGLDLGF